MDELTGALVLINPKLTDDPMGRQGQTGSIIKADIEADDVFVGFGAGPPGLYSTDALLVLKPHHAIYKDLLTHAKEMEKQDFKTMVRISMLLESGSPKQLKEAISLAMTSDQVLSRSTVSLQDKLNQGRAENRVTEHGYTPAR